MAEWMGKFIPDWLRIDGGSGEKRNPQELSGGNNTKTQLEAKDLETGIWVVFRSFRHMGQVTGLDQKNLSQRVRTARDAKKETVVIKHWEVLLVEEYPARHGWVEGGVK